MVFWAIGFITSIATLSVYLEYAAYFPNRSGSEVVYLEQAYPRPRWLFPTTYAFLTVVLSFSASNAIGKYSSPRCASLVLRLRDGGWLTLVAVGSPRPIYFPHQRTHSNRLAT